MLAQTNTIQGQHNTNMHIELHMSHIKMHMRKLDQTKQYCILGTLVNLVELDTHSKNK